MADEEKGATKAEQTEEQKPADPGAEAGGEASAGDTPGGAAPAAEEKKAE